MPVIDDKAEYNVVRVVAPMAGSEWHSGVAIGLKKVTFFSTRFFRTVKEVLMDAGRRDALH